ncbi:MAG: molecular chaperone HtpG [Treponema sp.]|jgi:molecular chaperone HtpG|nr:molecular chaperone HtpG [Treponema sp.]
MAQHQFQTEVHKLLHLIIHSLYSNRDIFVRELVSNASDALDKLKYLTVAEDAYKSLSFEPRIDIHFDSDAKTFTISDNGIGMNETDLVESLGTIARSGTRLFLEKMTEEARHDSNLIGQFGVGFYSAFMVADTIEVLSKKALDTSAWKWTSDGKEHYTVEGSTRDSQGTTIILHLNAEGLPYANQWKIEECIKKYSNHIAFPIYLTYQAKEYDDQGKEKSSALKTERINSGTALWKRPKTALSDEDYNEFYKQIAHDSENPLMYIHTKAEGTLDYTTLFYIPQKAPYDMYHADYQPGVKLYVRRVFITDDDKELMPTWLRFVRGIIDSEDLPLNVSREILQQNKILTNIRSASVKKLLNEFKIMSENNKEKYATFIEQFNRPLKEGLYQDFTNQQALLLELVRFKSTAVDGRTSLEEYSSRMPRGRKYIYYIAGTDEKTLRASPLLEAYREQNIEVLIMDDEIDDIVIPAVGKYKEWEFRSINRAGADEELKVKGTSESEKVAQPIAEKIKKTLGDRVKDVRVSRRLQEFPACIIVDEHDPTMQMEQMLKSLGQLNVPALKPILEINGEHPLVQWVGKHDDEALIEDISHILLDQALLLEGIKIPHSTDFIQRINRLLTKTVTV